MINKPMMEWKDKNNMYHLHNRIERRKEKRDKKEVFVFNCSVGRKKQYVKLLIFNTSQVHL